jgi:anti-anti-sigma regulatory factor
MPKEEPQFLVNPYDDPVVVKVLGKASFLNSAPVKDLFDRLVKHGKSRFIIDFEKCTGMDSTFLGILAGLGIGLMKSDPPGSVVLCRLSERNHELIENLGLHRLLAVDSGDFSSEDSDSGSYDSIGSADKPSEVDNARMVLQAHENLVSIDESNKTKFQDVIAFLKNQVEGQ